MNLRRFYFILTTILSVFLFISGTGILYYINNISALEDLSSDSGDKNNINDFLKSFAVGKDPVNFLVLVGDKEEANTDTMMLVNFNPITDKLSILSIPRDTKVDVPGLKIPKINSLYVRKSGEKLVVNSVSDLLGVNIKYYVYFNIATFRKVIDLLGGVDYYVPIDMDYDDPTQNLHIHLKKGRQHLDGKKAEQLLRFRHPNGNRYSEEMRKYYDGSDIKRIGVQQNFIKEVIRQKANILFLPKLNEIVNVVYDNLETNITLNEIFKLLKNISDFNIDNVSMFTLPGSAQQIGGIWYYIHDQSETNKIVKQHFFSKGTFADSSNDKKTSGNKKNNSSTKSNNYNNGDSSQTKPKKDSESKENVTKNNPSNAESSIQGSTKPAP